VVSTIGTEIDRYAREYAALTIARTILAERIEAYAEEHQDPVLRRASEYLNIMTLGRYRRIKIGEDDNVQPAILVTEAEGTEKHIKDLSEGTGDQLYLALRLATIEDRFDGHPGPPLMLDDTLKNFDEARLIAPYRALANFSQNLQVIYFTPRLAVVAQAQQAMGEDVNIIYLGENSV
jgi:chromosome segregation protein